MSGLTGLCLGLFFGMILGAILGIVCFKRAVEKNLGIDDKSDPLREGYISKGGRNDPPTGPRPPRPQGYNPKPDEKPLTEGYQPIGGSGEIRPPSKPSGECYGQKKSVRES